MTTYDVAIVGGGIIGLATARALTRLHPEAQLIVVEKELEVGTHQTGHNSGVIHSGVYYRPGSLKARLCVEGAAQLVSFCREHGIAHAQGGKVVVATNAAQLPALEELERRGRANGLDGLRRLRGDELRRIEPHVAGTDGLYVPTTGTVDFGEVARTIARQLAESGVVIRTSFEVQSLHIDTRQVELASSDDAVLARGIVNCAGLYSDRIAAKAGVEPPVRIVPFRGEYYELTGSSAELVHNAIYPVPNPRLPFLGVHLNRDLDGRVRAGPNAVLAGAREGYSWGTVRPTELWDAVSFPGVWRLASRHWKTGAAEVARSLSRRRFAATVQTLLPEVRVADLVPGGSGVRAQAVTRDGKLHDDFLVVEGSRSVHVLNAPSPAATASLAIGDHLAGLIGPALDLK